MLQRFRVKFFIITIVLFVQEAMPSTDVLACLFERILEREKNAVNYIVNQNNNLKIELMRLSKGVSFDISPSFYFNNKGEVISNNSVSFNYNRLNLYSDLNIVSDDFIEYSGGVLVPFINSERKRKKIITQKIRIANKIEKIQIKKILLNKFKEISYELMELNYYKLKIKNRLNVVSKKNEVDLLFDELLQTGMISKRSTDDINSFFEKCLFEIKQFKSFYDIKCKNISYKYSMSKHDVEKCVSSLKTYLIELNDEQLKDIVKNSRVSNDTKIDSLRIEDLKLSNKLHTDGVFDLAVGPSFTYRSDEDISAGIIIKYSFKNRLRNPLSKIGSVKVNEIPISAEFNMYDNMIDSLRLKIVVNENDINRILNEIKSSNREIMYELSNALSRYNEYLDKLADSYNFKTNFIINTYNDVLDLPFCKLRLVKEDE